VFIYSKTTDNLNYANNAQRQHHYFNSKDKPNCFNWFMEDDDDVKGYLQQRKTQRNQFKESADFRHYF